MQGCGQSPACRIFKTPDCTRRPGRPVAPPLHGGTLLFFLEPNASFPARNWPPLCHNDIMLHTSTQGQASLVSDSVCQPLAWAQLQQAVASTFTTIKTWVS